MSLNFIQAEHHCKNRLGQVASLAYNLHSALAEAISDWFAHHIDTAQSELQKFYCTQFIIIRERSCSTN